MAGNMRNSHNHDNFFRSCLSNKTLAQDFFRRHLPSEILPIIDLKNLEFCQESYIDDDFKRSEIDVLFKANFDHQPGYLYLLVEHQSYIDKLMAFRLLKYMIKIMDQHLKNSKEKQLPIILPMVFYHGDRPYNGSLDVFELFGEHNEFAKSIFLRPFQLIDVKKIPDQEMQDSLYSGTMEFVYKHVHARNFLNYLKLIIHNILILARENKDLLNLLIKYVIRNVGEEQQEEIFNFFYQSKYIPEEVRKEMRTIADNLRDEGRERAISELRTIADSLRDEGKLEEKRFVVLNMLQQGVSNKDIARFMALQIDEVDNIIAESKEH